MTMLAIHLVVLLLVTVACSSQPHSINEKGEPVSRTLAVTFAPGDFSNNVKSSDKKVILSNGLSAIRLATSGVVVTYQNGKKSSIPFHILPDGAGVFAKPNGGWYYVSNAESASKGGSWNNGGVGAIEFNSNGRIVGYKRIASGTAKNCGGGKTPWNSWVTCEEVAGGKTYQIDPSGTIAKRVTSMGTLGFYESFAFDNSTAVPTFYVTRDAANGVLTRFTPNATGIACYNKPSDKDRWCTLNNGSLDYLVLLGGGETGSFEWTTDITAAQISAANYHPNTEGIDVANGTLFFTSKVLKRLTILNLQSKTYQWSSTQGGAFDKQPDQVARVLRNDAQSILYFCEDGGNTPGVHGRDATGKYFTILYGVDNGIVEETTGLAFSPDGKHMYVSFQHSGFIYDITRVDGNPFQGAMLDIKYHA